MGIAFVRKGIIVSTVLSHYNELMENKGIFSLK